MIEVKKRQGEVPSALLYRFTKKVKQSGVLKEAKRRRFYGRKPNRLKLRLSAKHRALKQAEISRLKKLGLL